MNSLARRTYETFHEHFGHRPAGGTVEAPGRVNLIGEHTDYNDGFVLPIAIDRHVDVAFERSESGRFEIWSEHAREGVSLRLSDLNAEPLQHWARYAAGMAWVIQEAGFTVPGFRAAVCTNLPVGAGVSSSAAFEVGLGTALSTACGHGLEPKEIALLAHKSDREFVGIPSGIMDQFASACCQKGQAMLLDCRDASFEHAALGMSFGFVVVDTGRRRELLEGAYRERVERCQQAVDAISQIYPTIGSLRDVEMHQLESVKSMLDTTTFCRARHVVTEMRRPHQFVAAMTRDDLEDAGRLLLESHASLAQDYEVSCHELDTAVEIAIQHSACYGARLTGAGFGGSAIALCDKSATDEVAGAIEEAYRASFGAGRAYPVAASHGAQVLSLANLD
jgi:galactokinase